MLPHLTAKQFSQSFHVRAEEHALKSIARTSLWSNAFLEPAGLRGWQYDAKEGVLHLAHQGSFRVQPLGLWKSNEWRWVWSGSGAYNRSFELAEQVRDWGSMLHVPEVNTPKLRIPRESVGRLVMVAAGAVNARAYFIGRSDRGLTGFLIEAEREDPLKKIGTYQVMQFIRNMDLIGMPIHPRRAIVNFGLACGLTVINQSSRLRFSAKDRFGGHTIDIEFNRDGALSRVFGSFTLERERMPSAPK